MPTEATVLMEDARIIFRNFEGREGRYNRAGDRNFCVLLPEELAAQMAEDDWNVKSLRAREQGDPDQPYIQVKVGFKFNPPKIVLITSRGRNDIGEDMIDMLDWIDIAKVDLIIRPYDWKVSGDTGRTAYLKTIFITVNEDALELKYAEIEDALPARAGRVED
jgi:hypothetical protein